ncbi:D-alanyl-D-alanine carboxypeptidase [Bacillus licheniformis]|nr:D-alanyl-D-alanine carboxypeptidase [Bacillus licheniformis]
MPQGASRVRQWVAVWEPSEYALDLFKQALHQQGIRILGKTKIGKAPKQRTASPHINPCRCQS